MSAVLLFHPRASVQEASQVCHEAGYRIEIEYHQGSMRVRAHLPNDPQREPEEPTCPTP